MSRKNLLGIFNSLRINLQPTGDISHGGMLMFLTYMQAESRTTGLFRLSEHQKERFMRQCL